MFYLQTWMNAQLIMEMVPVETEDIATTHLVVTPAPALKVGLVLTVRQVG